MLLCFKMLLSKTYRDKIYGTFLYLVLQTPTDDGYLMVKKKREREREKKPYILIYNNACRECHVLNFVTKVKPEKKGLEKQHAHVILNDEVDFFLCSQVKIKKCI